jgi:hypothetical protein
MGRRKGSKDKTKRIRRTKAQMATTVVPAPQTEDEGKGTVETPAAE